MLRSAKSTSGAKDTGGAKGALTSSFDEDEEEPPHAVKPALKMAIEIIELLNFIIINFQLFLNWHYIMKKL
jgi:Glu-tRNA(Gln) amidotransferase subunit E-like FAD-binding protein